jgi:uncharacterized lipoprotein YmbA
MSRPARRLSPWLAIGVLTVLAGCGGMLSEPPQRKLYQLKAPVAFAAPQRHSSAQLLLALPWPRG